MIMYDEHGRRTQIHDKCWAKLSDKQRARYSSNPDGTSNVEERELLVESITNNAPEIKKKEVVIPATKEEGINEGIKKPVVKRIVRKKK